MVLPNAYSTAAQACTATLDSSVQSFMNSTGRICGDRATAFSMK